MQSAKEKISNMASSAKQRMIICKAKLEEKVEKAAARTPEAKEIAKERRKAKEAQAKTELHHAKAKHAAEKSSAKHSHNLPGHHPPVVGAQHGTNEPAVGTHLIQPVGTAL